MAKITVMPMMGNPRSDRLYSLNGCHAMYETSERRTADPERMVEAITDAIRQTLLTRYVRQNLVGESKVSLIITMEI